MGATTFDTSSSQEDVREAYLDCREQALYEYGHRGYTGTIAEKDGYVVVDLPSGVTPGEFVQAMHWAPTVTDWVENTLVERANPLPRPVWASEEMLALYDDKWGPAVAIKQERGWFFCGWASC